VLRTRHDVATSTKTNVQMMIRRGEGDGARSERELVVAAELTCAAAVGVIGLCGQCRAGELKGEGWEECRVLDHDEHIIRVCSITNKACQRCCRCCGTY
jgi:hypothetical protein